MNADPASKPAARRKKSGAGVSGICTFCRAPYVQTLDEIDADIAVLGVPYDGGTGYRPGHRFGPRGIREYSMRFGFFDQSRPPEERGYWDMKTRRRLLRNVSMVDCGDIDIVPADIAGLHRQIDESIRTILKKGAFPVVMGGDHSVSYPVVRAFEEKGPLGIVHFDAHLDRSGPVPGVENGYYGSGSPLRGIGELEFVDNEKLVSIGMRGIRNSEKQFLAAEEKGEILIPNYVIQEEGVSRTIERIPSMGNCYVTIDIDVLDNAIAPGIGSPEAEGMDYTQLKEILLAVAAKTEVVGLDVMSVAPERDPSGRTQLVTAQLMVEFLGAVFG